MEKADESLRLGFEVENLKETMSRIVNSNWIVLSKITAKEWGNTALVQDLDGRKIELKQKHSFGIAN